MSKTFLQLFEKYHPVVEERELLERTENLGVKIDKVNRRAEVRLRFPSTVEKQRLYAIEESVKKAYGLSSFTILGITIKKVRKWLATARKPC